MTNGSFHVIRRLAQDVPGWWAQAEAQAQQTNAPSLTSDALAAKLVGRWRSGTPLAHAPDSDMRSGHLSDDDNDFEYSDDPDGLKTPRFAHIRKAYPRDQANPGEGEAERHRIMRRGIPFGLPFDPALGRGFGVDAERGLVFAAFMASIEKQFEFIQQQWVNATNFPADADGIDPVIGTGGAVALKRNGIADQPLNFMQFVTTEGALYAFAPSLPTLQLLASGQPLPA
jgi:Dyp-type peroxidase family